MGGSRGCYKTSEGATRVGGGEFGIDVICLAEKTDIVFLKRSDIAGEWSRARHRGGHGELLRE